MHTVTSQQSTPAEPIISVGRIARSLVLAGLAGCGVMTIGLPHTVLVVGATLAAAPIVWFLRCLWRSLI